MADLTKFEATMLSKTQEQTRLLKSIDKSLAFIARALTEGEDDERSSTQGDQPERTGSGRDREHGIGEDDRGWSRVDGRVGDGYRNGAGFDPARGPGDRDPEELRQEAREQEVREEERRDAAVHGQPGLIPEVIIDPMRDDDGLA